MLENFNFYVTNLELFNDFNLNINGYDFEITKLPDYDSVILRLRDSRDSLNRGFTAKINVKNVSDFDIVKKIVRNICEMLSYAGGNSVVATRWESEDNYKGGGCASPESKFICGNFVIHKQNIEYFLNSTYENYEKYRDVFGLNVIIDGLFTSDSLKHIEPKLLMNYGILEFLGDKSKKYFESIGNPLESSIKRSNEQKMRRILNGVEISEEKIEKLINNFIYPHPSLQDCIIAVKKEFDLEYNIDESKNYLTGKNIYSIRNDIIHRLTLNSEIDFSEIYDDLNHLIDIIFLNIIGYSGEFSSSDTELRYRGLRGY